MNDNRKKISVQVMTIIIIGTILLVLLFFSLRNKSITRQLNLVMDDPYYVEVLKWNEDAQRAYLVQQFSSAVEVKAQMDNFVEMLSNMKYKNEISRDEYDLLTEDFDFHSWSAVIVVYSFNKSSESVSLFIHDRLELSNEFLVEADDRYFLVNGDNELCIEAINIIREYYDKSRY